MSGPEVINVLIAFNADDILKDYPPTGSTPENPKTVPADDKYIYMMVKQANIIGSSGANLNLSAKVGDVIRWRETTFSFDANYSALLYKYVGSDEKLISPPNHLTPDSNLPYLTGQAGDPSFKSQTVTGHYWSAEVLRKGEEFYHFSFEIISREGEALGYYSWDPKLTVK
ncbi:AidA/PixA family protein [Kitasatospora sp. NPDC101447]|uniref:AidA/PixA family protein n=1 Tax=Kitasatospora sp. NPDC101447 TaxID=3364102 RepID=UPI0037F4DB5A